MADSARQLFCLSQFIFAQFGKTMKLSYWLHSSHCFVSARQFKIVLPRLNIHCLTDASFVCYVCNLGKTIFFCLSYLYPRPQFNKTITIVLLTALHLLHPQLRSYSHTRTRPLVFQVLELKTCWFLCIQAIRLLVWFNSPELSRTSAGF